MPFRRRRPPGAGAKLALSARPRMGMGRSRTLTRTVTKRKKKRRTKTHVAGMNGSMSSTRLGRRFFKSGGVLAKQVVHKQTVATSLGNFTLSSIGKQQVLQLPILTAADLISIRTLANGGVATDNQLKLFLYESKQKIHLRNQHNALVTVLIYDISTKSVPLGSSMDSPTEAWETGLQNMGLAVNHSLNIHQTPSFSPEFRRFFKIQKVTKVLMEAGQQHEHSVYMGTNRLVDTTAVGTGGITSMPGLTSWCMIVHYGSLAHETAITTTVSYTAARLDYTVFKSTVFAFPESELPTYTLTNGLATAFIDADMMGENQDVDLDPNNA